MLPTAFTHGYLLPIYLPLTYYLPGVLEEGGELDYHDADYLLPNYLLTSYLLLTYLVDAADALQRLLQDADEMARDEDLSSK